MNEVSSVNAPPPPVNLKKASVKFWDVAVKVIVPLPPPPAALYSITFKLGTNDTVFESEPAAPGVPVLDLLNDCLISKLNAVPSALLPEIG